MLKWICVLLSTISRDSHWNEMQTEKTRKLASLAWAFMSMVLNLINVGGEVVRIDKGELWQLTRQSLDRRFARDTGVGKRAQFPPFCFYEWSHFFHYFCWHLFLSLVVTKTNSLKKANEFVNVLRRTQIWYPTCTRIVSSFSYWLRGVWVGQDHL